LEATPKYRVIGTDLSKSAVATAQQHAHQRFQHIPNINDRVTLADADFTRLTSVPAISSFVTKGATATTTTTHSVNSGSSGRVDVTICCDNALPHLSTQTELISALRSMFDVTRSNGMLIASIRDYDAILNDKKREMTDGKKSIAESLTTFTPPALHSDGDTTTTGDSGASNQRIVFQMWKWAPSLTHYTVSLFVLKDTTTLSTVITSDTATTKSDVTNITPSSLPTLASPTWSTSHQSCTYRLLCRADVDAAASEAGWTRSQWIMPSTSGFYQPLFIAFKP
jgi:hypothetical protein